MSQYQQIREECAWANRELPRLGLVDLTFGNVSVANESKTAFAIKPSGVDYQDLLPAQMVIVNLDGEVIEGTLRPSSDTPTHAYLLKHFPAARSVVHTHSRYATSWAQAGTGIPCYGTTHADFFYGEIPVTRPLTPAEIAGHYELETGKVIVERFDRINPEEVPAVLVHGHGPFVWGPSAQKAVEYSLALEVVSQLAMQAIQITRTTSPLSPEQMKKHYFRKHGATAYYGQATV
jgi:L-ribulose-5-phosphate 4-epimerase